MERGVTVYRSELLPNVMPVWREPPRKRRGGGLERKLPPAPPLRNSRSASSRPSCSSGNSGGLAGVALRARSSSLVSSLLVVLLEARHFVPIEILGVGDVGHLPLEAVHLRAEVAVAGLGLFQGDLVAVAILLDFIALVGKRVFIVEEEGFPCSAYPS